MTFQGIAQSFASLFVLSAFVNGKGLTCLYKFKASKFHFVWYFCTKSCLQQELNLTSPNSWPAIGNLLSCPCRHYSIKSGWNSQQTQRYSLICTTIQNKLFIHSLDLDPKKMTVNSHFARSAALRHGLTLANAYYSDNIVYIKHLCGQQK